jgi:hypothetical protein
MVSASLGNKVLNGLRAIHNSVKASLISFAVYCRVTKPSPTKLIHYYYYYYYTHKPSS